MKPGWSDADQSRDCVKQVRVVVIHSLFSSGGAHWLLAWWKIWAGSPLSGPSWPLAAERKMWVLCPQTVQPCGAACQESQVTCPGSCCYIFFFLVFFKATVVGLCAWCPWIVALWVLWVVNSKHRWAAGAIFIGAGLPPPSRPSVFLCRHQARLAAVTRTLSPQSPVPTACPWISPAQGVRGCGVSCSLSSPMSWRRVLLILCGELMH